MDCFTHFLSSIDVNNRNEKTLTCWNIELNVQSSHICSATIGNLESVVVSENILKKTISRSLFPWLMDWRKEIIYAFIYLYTFDKFNNKTVVRQHPRKYCMRKTLTKIYVKCQLQSHVTFIIWLMMHFLLIFCQCKNLHTHISHLTKSVHYELNITNKIIF